MDPYKVLGISANQVKHQTDVDKVRHRAKVLFKRLSKEGKKFDAKKVLEAFELVKQRQKSRLGEGQYKLLGRSRKERELDRHFNHQTKEIKNDKRLKKALKAARHGTLRERLHLPGDKERIPRHRRRRHRDRRRRRAEMKRKRQSNINIIEGLRRLAIFLPQEQKFPKVIKLLYRWMKEYMNTDTREYAFKVLDGVAQCDFLTDDPDSRQDIIQVFEYVLAYFKEWFAKGEDNALLADHWHLATVLACQCYTDDAFVLASVISKLNKMLDLLEQHRDRIGVVPEKPWRVNKEGAMSFSAKREKLEKDEPDVKSEDGEKPKPEENGVSGAKEDKAKIEEDAHVNGRLTVKDGKRKAEVEPPTTKNGSVKKEEERKKEAKSEHDDDSVKSEDDEFLIKDESDDEGEGSVKDANMEVLSSGSDICDIDSADDICDIDSGGSDELEEVEIGDDSDGSDEVLCEEQEEQSSGEVEEVEGSVWPTPPCGKSLDLLRSHFVDRCLAALFHRRGPLWARPKIDTFFQDVFYRRSVLTAEQQTQVEAWQSRIKTNQRLGERDVGEANNPLEAQRPVVDSREMRTVINSDSNTWAAKQTFDSRESAAQRVIR